MKLFKNQKGFTLIELLVVIGILAVLLAITLIAINPARQFSQANNTKRRSDVNAILNAVNQYMADNAGAVPAGITETVAAIATDDGAGAAEADICALLVPDYIAALPSDPGAANDGVAITACGVAYNTEYEISQSATNSRITVSVAAGNQELGEVISVTR
ncbi:MAG: prepilin-type N-terminal cleavage/methylation domain-containing protein [Candidatus Levybacteria bacterium]|nr:prepilin-type N-terminal cleavage/methylation domain-containing protein [Candidatus Levybacteria bacterium]